MKIVTSVIAGTLLAASAFADPFLVSSPAGLGVNDFASWSQLGSDQTVLGFTFTAASGGGIPIAGTFINGAGSIISVVCPATPSCSWIPSGTSMNPGDSLIVTSNSTGGATGPINFTFGQAVHGAGLEIQVDVPGTYTASIQAFNGSASLGSPATIQSDSAGDPLFIGLLSTTPDITGINIGLSACGGLGCNTNDFAVDTLDLNTAASSPEPSGIFLAAGALGFLLAWRFRTSVWRYVAAAAFIAPGAFSQIQATGKLPVLDDSTAVKSINSNNTIRAAAQPIIAQSNPLPIGLFSVVAYDGNTYQGEIVGRSPWTRGLRSTSVQVAVIPLIVKTPGTGGPYTSDPTSGDTGCLGSGNTAFGLTQASPILNAPPTPWTMNGVTVGGETYNDAHLRAEFWSLVSPGGDAYHLTLPYTAAPAVTLDASTQTSTNASTVSYGGSCGSNTGTTNNANKLSYVNINYLDPFLQTTISNLGLQHNQFPFFVMYRTVIADGNAGTLDDCCILGYHNNENSSTEIQDPGQTYGIAIFDTGDVFGGVANTSVMAHEVGEWINDPGGVNPTPVYASGQTATCAQGGQNNLEVGDPLSGISNNHVLTMPNGFTYQMQELAYFSWFFSADHAGSLGAGVCAGLGSGCHSTNGTFRGPAQACPAGGAYPN